MSRVAHRGSRPGSADAGSTSAGQCTRYSEYEISPTNVMARTDSMRVGPPALSPAAMTAAVPSTGSAAAAPGKKVADEKKRMDAATAAIPAQPTIGAHLAGTTLLRRRSSTATRPPTPSSHARDGSAKNAHGCDAKVSQTHNANDDATTTMSTASRARRERASAHVRASSAGQSR